MNKMSRVDHLALIDEMEQADLPFRQFWNISSVYFTDTVPTAAVSYRTSDIAILINQEFWDSLTRQTQLFVLCHEQLHVILDHFDRLGFREGDAWLKNIAADISVNHMLVRNYSFKREDLSNWESFCWVDTVFVDDIIPDNETAFYYYALLKQKADDIESSFDSFDDHCQADEMSQEQRDKLQEAIDEFVQEQTEGKTEEEQQEWLDEYEEFFRSLATEGMGSGVQEHVLKPKQDMTWKSVYLNIPKRALKEKTHQHWIRPNRRFAMLPNDLLLPTTLETTEQDIVIAHVYLDSSGSCFNHAKYFLDAALTLPKKLFKIRAFGFGTTVYDIHTKPPYRLQGFLNESYEAVSKHVDEYGKGVDAIMVFTDGYSQKVEPTQPEKWHWFITPNGTTERISSKCHTYNLKDLHWEGMES